ncbi:outer membrane beta-barrel protein [Marinospirillum sp. MEB164]|uniref:Outer membrane beta-barrel protein n=1 Tax=Marinospirillum alkalitolerans TaxID=3123374 RepID=A0ABW8PTI5_9GAMM
MNFTKKHLAPVITASLLALSGQATAQALDYNRVEAGLAMYPGISGHTPIGIDLRGSFELDEFGAENFFAFGGLQYLTDKLDYTLFHVGGGYQHAVNQQTSLWGGVTIEYTKVEYSNWWGKWDASDTSLGLRGGVRHQIQPDLELGGSLRLITGDLDYVGITGSVRYDLQPQFYLLGEIDLFDGDLGFIGGIGMHF